MDFKYIRFFISSTFADMNRERNLLNGVLDRLKHKYAALGWAIEWIDLRWGISRESSLENKTMTVCLDELKRCQKLSPRPNFIVLIGDRYGWVPLPEAIPAGDVDMDKYARLNKYDANCFNLWYKLDSNRLPNGMFILKSRTGEFKEDFIYETLAVEPLKGILSRITRGITSSGLELSATAHEIVNGIYGEAAKDTFIYQRKLTQLPQDEIGTFTETDSKSSESLRKLKGWISEVSDSENCMTVESDFRRYSSGEIDDEISNGMYAHLERIIMRVIAERRLQYLNWKMNCI